jgi:hypothetical protein
MRYILFGHPQTPGSIKRHVVETHVSLEKKSLVVETKISDFEHKVRAIKYDRLLSIKNHQAGKFIELDYKSKTNQQTGFVIPYSDSALGEAVTNLIKERMV